MIIVEIEFSVVRRGAPASHSRSCRGFLLRETARKAEKAWCKAALAGPKWDPLEKGRERERDREAVRISGPFDEMPNVLLFT